MFKKSKRFLFITLTLTNFFLICRPSCHAQNNQHSLMLWCDVGYSAFLTTWNSFKTNGNAGSGVGLGYQITAWNHFNFSIGIEYLSLNSSTRPSNFIIYKNLVDTEGDEYIMEYKLHKFVQTDKTHNLFIPIYFGFKTDLKKLDFFVQAGGKIGYMFAANYTSKIETFRTIGIYDRYIDPFENMPNHYFDTKKYSKTGDLGFNKLQAVVSLELGLEIPSVISKHTLRIGFFADYGLTNRQTAAMQKKSNELIVFETIPNKINMNNLYETNYKKSAFTNSIFVGVKIAFLFDVSRPPCPTCLSKSYGYVKKRR